MGYRWFWYKLPMIKSELLKYLFFFSFSFLSKGRKSRECFTRISLLLFFRTRVLNNSICTKFYISLFQVGLLRN